MQDDDMQAEHDARVRLATDEMDDLNLEAAQQRALEHESHAALRRLEASDFSSYREESAALSEIDTAPTS